MDHGKIVSRAWEITWNNRVLWGLGFFAALGSGASSSRLPNFNRFNFINQLDFDNKDLFSTDFAEKLQESAADSEVILDALPKGASDALLEAIPSIAEILPSIMVGAAVLICILSVLGIALWFVAQAARAGMITSVVGLQDGQKIGFGEAFRGGWKYVGRILGLKFLIYIGMLILISVIVAIGIAGFASEFTSIVSLLCPLAILFYFASILLSFVDAFAYRGIVLKDLAVIASMQHGWELVRNNLLNLSILGVIYGAVGMVMGMLIGLVVGMIIGVLIIAPIVPITAFMEGGEFPVTFMIVMIGVGGFVMTIIGALLNSILIAWRSTGFTLAYQELTGMIAVPLKEKSPEDIGYNGMI